MVDDEAGGHSEFDQIEEAVEAIRKGKIVIVLDDDNRENEGDFICAAQFVDAGTMNFLARYGRGIICAPITTERARALDLDLMVETNTSVHETPFTVSVDYRHGTTTGVSAADRAATVRALADEATQPADLARPGHIFPLRCCGGRGTRKRRSTCAASPG